MFIPTKQHSVLEAACGIQVFFDRLLPRPRKIANITSVSRNNGQSTIGLSKLIETIDLGQKITVSQISETPQFTIVQVPVDFLGDFTTTSSINTINNIASNLSFNQNLPNVVTTNVTGDLYKQSNISPSEQYLIEFIIESKLPNTVEAILRPNYYLVNGYEEFTPVTILEASSRFSKSAKILLKMIVKDYKSNTILKTQYQEIIISDSNSKPCEIIYNQPIQTSYYELSKHNNWSYYHEGYLLAEFIPSKEYKNIILQLVKKNDQLLPSRGGKNKIRIVADPIKLQAKKTSVDKIRNAILNQYDTINNSIAVANLGNKSYDIIVEDKLLKPEDLKDIIIDIVPPETGTPIKFSEVATASTYSADLYPIPSISLFKLNNNEFLGELHYNKQIYDQDPILVKINTTGTAISGIIMDITNGINYI